MGHVVDRWTVPGPSGRRVKGPRHGRGKRWLARWVEPDGRERSEAFATKDGAEAHLATVDVDIRAGSYVRQSRTTFQESATEWLRHQVHQSPDTAQKARRLLEMYAYPAFGHLPLQQVTRKHVQDLVADVSSEDGALGAGATRILYVYVRAVFAAAVEDRLLPVSPCRRINLPAERHALITPITSAQVARLAEQAPAHLAAAVWLEAGSGLRPGEMRGLTADRISGDGLVRVERQVAKGTTSRVVRWGPLKTPSSYRSVQLAPSTHKRVLEHIERFGLGLDGLLFAGERGGMWWRSQMSQDWATASAGLGLDARSGWHDLRHHHASLLIARGLSPRAVADRLGHRDPSETLKTYSHLWPSDQARILEAIEDEHGPETHIRPVPDEPETDLT